MSLACQKTLLAFLCQLGKIPNLLARHMSLTFHGLSPAYPSVSSPTFPAGPVPSTRSEYTQIQASALAVHTACDAVSPSSTQSKLRSLTKITLPPTPQVLLHWSPISLCMWFFHSTGFIGL